MTYAKMDGIDIARLEPAVLHEAAKTCSRCACREACRRWPRTGVFNYNGDPQCPNAELLRDGRRPS